MVVRNVCLLAIHVSVVARNGCLLVMHMSVWWLEMAVCLSYICQCGSYEWLSACHTYVSVVAIMAVCLSCICQCGG